VTQRLCKLLGSHVANERQQHSKYDSGNQDELVLTADHRFRSGFGWRLHAATPMNTGHNLIKP